MASQALAAFNTAVDEIPNGTNLTPARKETLKETGERLYIAGAKETIRHMVKHLDSVAGDAGETQARRDRAAAVADIIRNMASTLNDAWWLDVADSV